MTVRCVMLSEAKHLGNKWYIRIEQWITHPHPRFFAPLCSAQNDKEGRFDQNDCPVCHPEAKPKDLGTKLDAAISPQAICVGDGHNLSFVPAINEVVPVRIHCFDQLYLLAPQPSLDGLFSGDGRVSVGKCFVIDQFVDVIFLRKTLNQFVLMFIHSSSDVTGYSHIERTGPVYRDVNVVLVIFFHLLYCTLNFTKRPDSSPSTGLGPKACFTAFCRDDKGGRFAHNNRERFVRGDKMRCFVQNDYSVCHPEAEPKDLGNRKEATMGKRVLCSSPRFFVSLRSTQNDKKGCSAQNDKRSCFVKNDLSLCHPE
jgi:hypothetical protein